MNRITLTLALLLTVGFVIAQNPSMPEKKSNKPSSVINWMSFEKAVELNKKKSKKVFIDVFTTWCGWCKKYDAVTFSNPKVIAYMNKHFYNVKLNAERKDTVAFNGITFINPNPAKSRSAHQLAVSLLSGKMSHPSVVFMDKEMKLIRVFIGYHAPEQFQKVINWVGTDSYKKVAFEKYQPAGE